MAFEGFSPAFFGFFRALADNNDKTWFEANKARYERDVKAPLQAFVAAMAPRLAAISSHIVADPKKSVFRIHRDVRFSADKSPYKTNAGLHFRHHRAKDAHAPGFYVHLAPGEVFYGGGVWMPAPPALAAIRTAIVERPKVWAKAKANPGLVKAFGGLDAGDPLSRPPRGFDADAPHIDDIKKRSFFVSKTATEKDAAKGGAFLDSVTAACAAAAPLMQFLCEAVEVEF